MVEIDFEVLSSLGLSPVLASRAVRLGDDAAEVPGGARHLARIVEVHREAVAVHDGLMERAARALPRLFRAMQDEGSALAAGDWVLASVESNGQCWVTERVPPTSHIARRDADGRSHPVVSNIDVALLVMGLDDDFNPRRLERYLALVADESILKVVVLSKADVLPSTEVEQHVATLRARLPAGLPMLALNALDPSAADRLAAYVERGQTLVMLGSSGAGKSTLTNTLLGTCIQDTGEVRVHDSRGKHTTTSRSLHRLPGGACVIDTPGLRTLRPDGDASTLVESFVDIAALATRCRFRDCRHGDEPGCAVRQGVDADRLRNFHKLLREVRRDTLNPLDRQRQVAQWKVRGKATKARMKQKRDGSAL